jgi:hypothetical protein
MRVDPVKQLHEFSQTDLKTMQGVQQFTDVSQRQAQARAQVRNRTGQSHANTPLPKHFCAQIDWCLVPFLTPGAPAFKDAMFGHLDRGGGRNIENFSTPCQADSSQTQITIRADRQMMLDDLGGYASATRTIVLGGAFLPRFFLFGSRLLRIRFDKGRRRCFLLFQFLDALVCSSQLLLEHTDLLQGLFESFFQARNAFVCCHALSLSERSSLNSFLFYSDEVRHLAVPEEQTLFILISAWNLTSGAQSFASPATEQDTDYEYCQLNSSNARRRLQKTLPAAKAMTYHVFLHWLSGHSRGTQGPRASSIFEHWGITVDGQASSPMYFMYTQQARHTRQSVLAEDPNIAPLTRQRDLNHTSRDMQMVYQHHLQKANAKLRERVASHQLHGLGTRWLEQCLGLMEPDAQNAFREGTPHSFDARWQALLVNNPQFVQANRVPCGLCAFPQGPEGCPEFMHCTEATDEGCAWFLTDPDDIQMQRELHHRSREHRARQQESQTLGRTVQAHKYGVMAKRTERLRDEALQKTSEEVRRALLAELYGQEEMR